MPKNLTIIFVIIGLTTVAFFFGYRFGYRDTYNSTPPNIEYLSPNFGTPSNLSNLQIKSINGPELNGNTSDFKRGFLIVNQKAESSDLRILLKDVPAQIQTPEDKKNNIPAQKITFPNSLQVDLVTPNPVSRTLVFTKIADFNLNPPINNLYTGELNLSLENKNIKFSEGAFLAFYDATNKTQNLYEIQLKDYQSIELTKSRPFLWVDLQK